LIIALAERDVVRESLFKRQLPREKGGGDFTRRQGWKEEKMMPNAYPAQNRKTRSPHAPFEAGREGEAGDKPLRFFGRTYKGSPWARANEFPGGKSTLSSEKRGGLIVFNGSDIVVVELKKEGKKEAIRIPPLITIRKKKRGRINGYNRDRRFGEKSEKRPSTLLVTKKRGSCIMDSSHWLHRKGEGHRSVNPSERE